MSESASAILEGLDADQRSRAVFPFPDEAERTDWAYFPRMHKGLPLCEMTPRQQKLVHALVSASLSLHAYAKTTAIMALESVLNETEGRRLDAFRDPGRYFLSLFGSPVAEVWGWRFEGHHVCLNFTIVADEVSTTPLFLGANPAEVRHGDAPVIRPCGEEEDVARELLASLDEEQTGLAVICDVAPPDFVLTNAPMVEGTLVPGDGAPPLLKPMFEGLSAPLKEALRFDRDQPRGLACMKMNQGQRQLLSALIGVYLDRLPPPLASQQHDRIEAEGIEQVYFAWAGELRRRRPHYYRLQGKTFLVEYDNTQDEANHVHAVWRDMQRDFGRDLLRGHLRHEHNV